MSGLTQLAELVGIATVLFIATNLDDVFLLLGFFADRALRPRHIVAGQYLGLAVLYAASVLASLVSLVVPVIYLGLLGLVPIALGVLRLRGAAEEDEPQRTAGGTVAAVAAVTIASGGDNIAVYTPVFAVRPLGEIAVIGAVFAVLVAAWIGAAWWLISHPRWGPPLRRYGHAALPFVLIGIGALVLWEAGTWRLLVPQ